MGSFRFYRRVHIFPGLSVNLSKSEPSVSVRVHSAHVTVGRRGIRKTLEIPGTAIYYTSRAGYHTGVHSAHHEPPLNFTERAARRRRKAKANFVLAAIILAIAALTFALAMMRPR
jgi:Protein of unknown function (DUF4236)